MEQTMTSKVRVASGFIVALRHWSGRLRERRQHRADMKRLSRIPDHLLRDIGREDLIVRRPKPRPYGL